MSPVLAQEPEAALLRSLLATGHLRDVRGGSVRVVHQTHVYRAPRRSYRTLGGAPNRLEPRLRHVSVETVEARAIHLLVEVEEHVQVRVPAIRLVEGDLQGPVHSQDAMWREQSRPGSTG